MALKANRKSHADRDALNMRHFHEKAELMEATKLALAREEGMAEGIMEGYKEGFAQGFAEVMAQHIAKGIEKGFEEGVTRARADTATRMKDLGFDRETIKKATALSDADLDRLGIISREAPSSFS
ncbi:MAG: hypothetical protein RDV48_07170 [Candidatus Eremiobacteraeota bacterium]|nr:hypothetical protein [Candidatus Eremiobacteraeota bacterium]